MIFSLCDCEKIEVGYNKNTKKISVPGYLNYLDLDITFNRSESGIKAHAHPCENLTAIKIKLIADKADWKKLSDTFLEAFEQDAVLPLETITPYLSKRTGKKTRERFAEYYKSDPQKWAWELYQHFIEPVSGRVRLDKDDAPLTSKERVRKPHRLRRHEMKMLGIKFQWVYCFLLYWSKQKRSNYPEELKKHYKEKIHPLEVKHLTREIIERHYNDKISFKISFDQASKNSECDEQTFYNNYIARTNLTRIKKALLTDNYLPVRPPLSNIFHL